MNHYNKYNYVLITQEPFGRVQAKPFEVIVGWKSHGNLEISQLGRIFLPAYFVITGSYDLKDKVYAAINTSLSGRIIEFIIIYHFL